MKFLVIQTAFIGDVVLATPILEKLHRFYPEADIDVLVRKGNEGVLKDHPFIRNLFLFDKSNQKYRNLFNLVRTIRANRYNAVINVQRFATSGLLTVLSGANDTIGFKKNPFAFLFNHAFPHVISRKNRIHEVERNLSLIKHLTDNTYQPPRIYPSKSDEEGVDRSQPYVCIAPASVWFTKQWPKEKWIELINRIPESFHIHLLGAKSDVALCEEISSASSHPYLHNQAGKLSMLQSAAWMKYAHMNFVNDSAPMHFASAVNAPVTAMYLSTVPAFGFEPLSNVSFVRQTRIPLDCKPCGLHGYKQCPKGHFKCSDIDIDDVMKSMDYQNRI